VLFHQFYRISIIHFLNKFCDFSLFFYNQSDILLKKNNIMTLVGKMSFCLIFTSLLAVTGFISF